MRSHASHLHYAEFILSSQTNNFGTTPHSVISRSIASAGSRLNGRLWVSPEYVSGGHFDTVELSLTGTVRTQIGSRRAVENFIHLSSVKGPGDFQSPGYTDEEGGMRFVDFFFAIPHTIPVSSSQNATASSNLPSSTRVEATKFITKHTALRDRKAVKGFCNVSYQVGARFLHHGETVFHPLQPIEFVSNPAPQASLRLERPPQEFRSVARTAILHRPWRRGNGDLWVSVLEPEPLVWTAGAQPAVYSVNLAVELSLQRSPKAAPKPIECEVHVRWQAITTFSLAVEGNNDAVARSSNSTLAMAKTAMLKSQDTKLLFPPWYPVAAANEAAGADVIRATTMTNLTLVSPVFSVGPGCTTGLLSINYVLDVALSVKDDRGSGRKLSAKFRIPITFAASETGSTALKGVSSSLECSRHSALGEIELEATSERKTLSNSVHEADVGVLDEGPRGPYTSSILQSGTASAMLLRGDRER